MRAARAALSFGMIVVAFAVAWGTAGSPALAARSRRTPGPTATPSPTPTATAAPCVTSGPAGGAYAVTVCITSPTGGTVSGTSVAVSATATVTGTNPGQQRMVFTINGTPLLTDFVSPYTWTLDTTRWADGTYQLAVSAWMRDGFQSSPAVRPLNFSNGLRKAPTNPGTFTPTSGTAPAPGQPLVLAAVGDGAAGEPGETTAVNLISSWNPNLLLYLGDVYEDGTPMEFNNWYGSPSTPGLYGQLRSITDPTVGNHEYVGNSAAGYFYYWNNVPHYYSFNSAGWHFIALDSTTQFGQNQPGSAQYKWLQADLANDTAPCTVVYYHHPVFNTGPEGPATQMTAMWSLLAQYHVTLVLNGHDHDYQRYMPLDGSGNPSATGITEFVVGSGGHAHQAQVTSDSRMVASDFQDFGALRLSLSPTSAAFQFMNGANNAVVDSGLVTCKNTGSDTLAPTAPGSPAADAVSPGEIDLTWTASTDNVGIAGYDVYRDGSTTPLAVLPANALAYADTQVAPASSHSYTIDAFDAKGNHSPPAGPVSATTPDGTVTVILSPIADSYVSSSATTTNYGTSTVLRVAGGSTTMRSYLRFDLSKLVGSIQSASLRVMANSSTSLGFSAYGVGDNSWGEKTITYANAPTLAASAAGSSGSITSGSWASVQIGSLVGPAVGGLMSVALTGSGSQESLASRESATPPQLVVTIGSGSGGPPTASFTASATSVNVGDPVTFTDTSANAPTAWAWDFGDGTSSTAQSPVHSWSTAGSYPVTLTASNAYGATHATQSISVNTDSDPPTVPGSPAANGVAPGEIDVSWTSSMDNIGVAGYDVYRDGSTSPLAILGPSATSYADTAVAPASTHSYTVDAFDAAGNHSAPAGPVSATTPSGTITVVLNPQADSYVSSANPTTNYGTSTVLRVAGGSTIMRSYLRFDLSGLTGSIQSASLSILANSSTSLGFSGYGVSDNSWGETTINYANAPATAASASGSSGPITSGSWASVDVTSLAGPAEGGLLSVALTGSGTQESLASRNSANPPQLVITLGAIASTGSGAAARVIAGSGGSLAFDLPVATVPEPSGRTLGRRRLRLDH
jgi:PKD repeat protein